MADKEQLLANVDKEDEELEALDDLDEEPPRPQPKVAQKGRLMVAALATLGVLYAVPRVFIVVVLTIALVGLVAYRDPQSTLLHLAVRIFLPLFRLGKTEVQYVNIEKSTKQIIPATAIPCKATRATSRLVCLSDIHTLWDYIEIPQGDTLVITGDITFTDKYADYYITQFQLFLEKQRPNFKEIYVIAGNHDLILKRLGKAAVQQRLKPAIYLENDLVTSSNNISIFGSPWSPAEMKNYIAFQFYDPKEEDAFLKPIRDLKPGSVDVLMTHAGGYRENDLKPIVEKLKPRVNLSGHYHTQYGVRFIGDTCFINCANLNGLYWPKNPVVVLDIEPRR